MTTPGAKPRLSRETIVLGSIGFFVMVGFGVVIPVLPVFVREFGVGFVEVGAVISAFALMRLVAASFVGKLIDLLGERITLATGIGIVAASTALTGLAQSYPEVLIMRGLGGIGSAMFSISAMSLLLATTPPTLRGRAVGFYQGGFLLGGMTGPAIGGFLAAISLRAPFFFYAATLLVAGVIGVIMLRSPSRHVRDERDPATPPIPFRVVLSDRRYRAAIVANLAVGWSSFGVRTALIPVLIVEVLHESTVWTGIAIAVAAVAQTITLAPAGRFVDTIGRRPAIIGAFTLAGLVMIAIPFAGDIWTLIALVSAYGVAAAFMGTAPAAAVGDAAGGRTGQPVAVFSAVSDAGAILGALVAGILVDVLSFHAAFATALLMLLIASTYALLRMPAAFERA